MVPTIKRNILKPQYFDKFACIGGKCEDTCCKGWRITIDKKTYIKYKNVKNAQFQEKISKNVKRIRGNDASDGNYAEFVIDKDKCCAFQTEEGLCQIQKDMGAEYLSHTCMIYPRATKSIDGQFVEMSLRLSCPEVVRIALFNEQPMEFNAETLEFPQNDQSIIVSTRPADGKHKTQYIQYGWQMREAAITIMQKRTCSTAHRIIIIAMMLDEVVTAHDEGRAEQIPEILEFYSEGEYGAQFLESFDGIESNEDTRTKMGAIIYCLVKELARQSDGIVFARLLEKYKKESKQTDDVIANAGLEDILQNDGYDIINFLIFIEKMTEKHWNDFQKNWEYVLENYFVSFIYTELFPLTYLDKEINPYDHSFVLAEQYVLLKMLLCADYNDSEGFSKQFIVRTITNIAAMNQHSTKPLQIVENYKKTGMDSPAYLYYMLM